MAPITVNNHIIEIRVGDELLDTFPYELYVDGEYVNTYSHRELAYQKGMAVANDTQAPTSIYDVTEFDEVVFGL